MHTDNAARWREFKEQFADLARRDPTLEFRESTIEDDEARMMLTVATDLLIDDAPECDDPPLSAVLNYSIIPYTTLGDLRTEFVSVCRSAGREAIRQRVCTHPDVSATYLPECVWLSEIEDRHSPHQSLHDTHPNAYADAARLSAILCEEFEVVASEVTDLTQNGTPRPSSTTFSADVSADNQKKPLPSNPDVIELCRKLKADRGKGKSEAQIARDFVGARDEAGDRKAANLLRSARRYRWLWK